MSATPDDVSSALAEAVSSAIIANSRMAQMRKESGAVWTKPDFKKACAQCVEELKLPGDMMDNLLYQAYYTVENGHTVDSWSTSLSKLRLMKIKHLEDLKAAAAKRDRNDKRERTQLVDEFKVNGTEFSRQEIYSTRDFKQQLISYYKQICRYYDETGNLCERNVRLFERKTPSHAYFAGDFSHSKPSMWILKINV